MALPLDWSRSMLDTLSLKHSGHWLDFLCQQASKALPMVTHQGLQQCQALYLLLQKCPCAVPLVLASSAMQPYCSPTVWSTSCAIWHVHLLCIQPADHCPRLHILVPDILCKLAISIV